MNIRKIIILGSILLLTACGGGGGCSSSSDSASEADNTFFRGTQTVVILGIAEQQVFSMEATDTIVTINGEGSTATGARNGDNFTVNVPTFTQTDGDRSCVFSNFRYTGTISGASTSGDIFADVICNGLEGDVTGSFVGSES